MSSPSTAPSTTTSDAAAVEAAARDYIEGWYTGDAERMERSLHDDLVKRIPVEGDGSGATELRMVSKERMVELTTAGGGTDVADPAIGIFVDDVSVDIACARVVCADFLDYVHLVKTSAGWKIANVIFRSLG